MNKANKNMPILWQNAMGWVETEIGRKAWIWFAETRGHGMLYEADRYAWEVDRLVLSLRPMIDTANKAHGAADEVIDDLMRFILLRHANWRFGANVRPAFLGPAA